ncbi:MAG: HAD family hydrolase [bacterium]|nr:HAD family hydrolase [bacterium]
MPKTLEAVFLDRDGVINEEHGYEHRPQYIRLLPGAAAALRRVNELSIPVIIVSNQSGIARGYYMQDYVDSFHKQFSEILKDFGASIDHFYYCPHHPTAGEGDYTRQCDCRKPLPGLLERAARDLNLDLENCVLIGDKAIDIGARARAGCRTILVMTGYGKRDLDSWIESYRPDETASDLAEAVELILKATNLRRLNFRR